MNRVKFRQTRAELYKRRQKDEVGIFVRNFRVEKSQPRLLSVAVALTYPT